MVSVIHYIALLGSLIAGMLVLPALLAFAVGEAVHGRTLLMYAALGGFLSFSILMSVQGKWGGLNRISSVYLVVLSWIFVPLVTALPFQALFDISYTQALFEAVSAFTTTSADSIINIDAAPRSAVWLRSQTAWLGGLATLASFAVFLGPIRIGGLPQSAMDIGDNLSAQSTSVTRVLITLFQAYLFLTLICFIFLVLAGMQPFAASILAATSISTSAYVPNTQPVLDFVGPAGMLVMSVFLLVGATSIFWHRMIARMQVYNLKRHRESYLVLGSFLVMSIVLFILVFRTSGTTTSESTDLMLVEAVFNSASLVSTSGIESRTGIFALLSPVLAMSIIMIGAGCYSTAGGIKISRIVAMLSHANKELSLLVYPHGVGRVSSGQQVYTLPILKMVWTMVSAAIFIVCAGALALSATGMDFHASLMAAISAFSNAGPVYSPEWVERGTQGWPAYSAMTKAQLGILSAIMIFGRLEVIVLLAAINPFYWLRR